MTSRFHLNNGVSVVFDEQVLPHLKGMDQEVLKNASCVDDTSRYLKELSPQLKDCLLAIGGAGSADLLGVDPGSCSMPFLDLHCRRFCETRWKDATRRCLLFKEQWALQNCNTTIKNIYCPDFKSSFTPEVCC